MPINNLRRAKQFIDLESIDTGTDSKPTDIDGFLEFFGEMFIFYEFKLRGAEMSKGQRLAYEHVVDALIYAGRYACVLVCEHEVYECDESVIASESKVRETYFGNKWTCYQPPLTTAQEATKTILEYWNGEAG